MSRAGLLVAAFVLASSAGQGAGRREVGTASFHVGAMSCVSCEKAIRANLSRMKSVDVVLASAAAKRVQLRFDVEKVSMQEILATIAGKAGTYEARLALKYADPQISPARAEKAQLALARVPGVRAASLPDEKGVILLTFRSQPAAFLPAILKAAAHAGTPLVDPADAPTKSNN